ncbi:DEAD/DEAH box helicase [Faecalimonas umbilicata]|nr:DEAD/DEAH box helicase [Faecalimonas umbilicata]
MKEKKKDILEKWLKIDFYSVANKANLIVKKQQIDEELIYDTIRCLDYETIMEKNPSINYVITIIGLLWEHINHQIYDIRPIVVKFLSRIGYPTSAIICDKDFDLNACSFSHLPSWIDEVMTTMHQDKNQVEVCGKKYLLTDFQERIWDCMDRDKLIGISAPTSAGKSFVILLKLVERLSMENLDIVYIVPTLSLVNQVTEDFNRELKTLKIAACRISNSFDNNQGRDNRNIYVLTQEKAIAAFADSEEPFTNKMILVVDEIQNIERIKEETDERAKILFDTLTEFRYKKNVIQIIISGPRIEKVDEVGKGLFGLETNNLTTMVSPVVNLTYSIEKIDRKFYFKQYCTMRDQPIMEEINNAEGIKGYGQKGYTDSYLSYLDNFVSNVGKDAQNIIFAPTSKGARKIALALRGDEAEVETELINYYQSTIRQNYVLCNVLQKGVAYHHGKLPMHVRRTLEKAITEKKIKNVICTTTLLQGVNLPAQNIFIRNPHLYIKKMENSTELTSYEMANLRGRAGRLLKDFVGRTYVMDENEFSNTDGYEQLELFEEVTKELPTNYEQKYEEYKDYIAEALDSNKPVDSAMQKYGYLISYIRQSILRYGKESRKKMKDVGITLTQKQVAAIIMKLNEISVPREICLKNRYWDPLVLDIIYKNFTGNMPLTPFEKGAREKINNALRFLRDTKETFSMYNRYIPSKYQNGKMRSIMLTLCMRWAKENSLKEILNDKRYDGDEGADNIDETIELLENTISFGIPLLLNPIFDMKNPESIVLACMQTGAFNIITRTMIEMGIARETSIFLSQSILSNIDLGNKGKDEIETLIRTMIKENYGKLPYWIKVQIEFLI